MEKVGLPEDDSVKPPKELLFSFGGTFPFLLGTSSLHTEL